MLGDALRADLCADGTITFRPPEGGAPQRFRCIVALVRPSDDEACTIIFGDRSPGGMVRSLQPRLAAGSENAWSTARHRALPATCDNWCDGSECPFRFATVGCRST